RPEEDSAERNQNDLRARDEEAGDEDADEDEGPERLPGVHQRAHRCDVDPAPEIEAPEDDEERCEPGQGDDSSDPIAHGTRRRAAQPRGGASVNFTFACRSTSSTRSVKSRSPSPAPIAPTSACDTCAATGTGTPASRATSSRSPASFAAS